MEIVFNRNALDINNAGEAGYLVKVGNIADKSMMVELLRLNLINHDGENDFRIVEFNNEEYQSLFMEWQGFIF